MTAKKARRCSMCGSPQHNRRRCPHNTRVIVASVITEGVRGNAVWTLPDGRQLNLPWTPDQLWTKLSAESDSYYAQARARAAAIACAPNTQRGPVVPRSPTTGDARPGNRASGHPLELQRERSTNGDGT